jgi:hypothetical protein
MIWSAGSDQSNERSCWRISGRGRAPGVWVGAPSAGTGVKDLSCALVTASKMHSMAASATGPL